MTGQKETDISSQKKRDRTREEISVIEVLAQHLKMNSITDGGVDCELVSELSDSETEDSSDDQLHQRPTKKPTAGKRLRKKRGGANSSVPVAAPVAPSAAVPRTTAIPVATPQVPLAGMKPVSAPRIPDQTKSEEAELKQSPEKGRVVFFIYRHLLV